MLLKEILVGRYAFWAAICGLTVLSALGILLSSYMIWPTMIFGFFAILGCRDYFKSTHPVRANYPLMGRLRYLFESIRPELRQYFWESDTDETPYSRNQRAIVYQRAKNNQAKRSFGTEKAVYEEDFNWLNHSLNPIKITDHDFRTEVGALGKDLTYSMSLLNISGMSFGALSPPAVQALSQGAQLGGFAQNTGEGSLSRYHASGGGDLIWQISTGYFGCRTPEGGFDPELFKQNVASTQVKMIEIKLSQGAKPGHGGVLPAPKVTEEIAHTRGIPVGQTCESPASHSEFSTPAELLEFSGRLKSLSGGKPVGIKLCIGHPWEFVVLVKAMVETGEVLDFITVDGSEGGTGAAPTEFSDHIGSPLRDAIVFVDNTLRGAGLRGRVKIGASAKIVSAYDITRVCALGADWCNMARPFMFALGCIQAKDCGSGHCPTGITTMDPQRYRAIDIPSRAERVRNFHKHTLEAVAELLGAAGIPHPKDLNRRHIVRRLSASQIKLADQIYPRVSDGALLTGEGVIEDPRLRTYWSLVSKDSFHLSDEQTALT
ncbi:MAG: FMN-binding glutamate synthase family protein [Pseudomonadota bacterium]|nr:FMN-binding glutamate synthase family protein [Pseudomonadota bacterium]